MVEDMKEGGGEEDDDDHHHYHVYFLFLQEQIKDIIISTRY